MIASFVAALFFPCRPAAIVGAIVLTVVCALKRMARAGSLAHVLKKGVKIITPTFTDLDATRSVIGITDMARVIASLSHVRPRVIFRRPRAQMTGSDGSNYFTVEASTRLCCPFTKGNLGNGGQLSADASAIPISGLTATFAFFEYCQSAKNLSSQIHAIGSFCHPVSVSCAT